jgi:hypothetical protein
MLAFVTSLRSQNIHIGIFGGVSAYGGELTDKILPKKLTHAALGITGSYEVADNIMVRAGLTFASVEGADRYSRDTFSLKRNLSFNSRIVEASVVGEFYFFNLYEKKYSPYLFAGLAIYHFNPYTYDNIGLKVYLKPLSTEGEGLPGYPQQPYSLTQFALPFGGGIKFAINDNIRIGVEAGIRKLFTDHLDDVSTNYASMDDLLAARGQTAVDLSYRGDEVEGGDPVYPAKGSQRGGSQVKDYYYFGGLHLSFRLGGEKSSGKVTGSRSHRSRFGCPANMN